MDLETGCHHCGLLDTLPSRGVFHRLAKPGCVCGAFYNQQGPVLPFFEQMVNLMVVDPWLNPYQALRALIWTAYSALPIVRGSRWNVWQTALVVGLMFSVPQNIGHILPNSMIPHNSVRMSHLLETASSTFVFGLIVTWLLYPIAKSRAVDPNRSPIDSHNGEKSRADPRL